ncbi:hypothetical protein NDU88_002083 [Pleurodeles waltl]|uniref:Uncharacterized protein n=1 Tax=Pleurodeles waltl TaxID=8319 RepID=A0AAV7P5V5_PLEWA|nr:hypothetical protein NDU88_002083 [Pleurodeles waltl]
MEAGCFGVGLRGGADGGEESLWRGRPLDRPAAGSHLERFELRVGGNIRRWEPVPQGANSDNTAHQGADGDPTSEGTSPPTLFSWLDEVLGQAPETIRRPPDPA